MNQAFHIFLILFAFASPLSGEVPPGDAEPPQIVFASSPPLELLQPTIVLPSLVPGLPVSNGYSLKTFEGKYRLQNIGHRGVSGGMNFISTEEELKLGTQLAKEVDADVAVHLATDPMITEYVNRLAQNIARASDTSALFTVKVIDSDQANAFSLPGGFLYLNTGLFMMADDEAELAGVIGHEVAHVAARHATRQITRGMLISSIFSAATPKRGIGRVLGQLSAMVAEDLLDLKFSRGFEEEADLLGLQYLYAAGYDLSAYARILEKMQQRELGPHNFLERLFSTHPVTRDRIVRCQRLINDYFPSREAYYLTTSEFDTVKVRIARQHMNRMYLDENEEERPLLRRRSADR